MAVKKVILNNNTIMSVEDTTAVEEDVAQGKVFYKSNGSRAIGTNKGGDSSPVTAQFLYKELGLQKSELGNMLWFGGYRETTSGEMSTLINDGDVWEYTYHYVYLINDSINNINNENGDLNKHNQRFVRAYDSTFVSRLSVKLVDNKNNEYILMNKGVLNQEVWTTYSKSAFHFNTLTEENIDTQYLETLAKRELTEKEIAYLNGFIKDITLSFQIQESEPVVEPTSIIFNSYPQTMEVGQEIAVSVSYDKGEGEPITLTSKDDSVITVSGYSLLAKSVGTTQITAQGNGLIASVTIEVTSALPSFSIQGMVANLKYTTNQTWGDWIVNYPQTPENLNIAPYCSVSGNGDIVFDMPAEYKQQAIDSRTATAEQINAVYPLTIIGVKSTDKITSKTYFFTTHTYELTAGTKDTGADIINFAIEEVNYQAETNMAFSTWANTNYNTTGFANLPLYPNTLVKKMFSDNPIAQGGMYIGLVPDNQLTDIITDNGTYKLGIYGSVE